MRRNRDSRRNGARIRTMWVCWVYRLLVLLLGELTIASGIFGFLAVDLIVFGSLIVILISGADDGRGLRLVIFAHGLGADSAIRMNVSIRGWVWRGRDWKFRFGPLNALLSVGHAATLARCLPSGPRCINRRSAFSVVRLVVLLQAGPSSFCCGQWASDDSFFRFEPMPQGVIAAQAAGGGQRVSCAQHYGNRPHRVVSSILISTALVCEVSLGDRLGYRCCKLGGGSCGLAMRPTKNGGTMRKPFQRMPAWWFKASLYPGIKGYRAHMTFVCSCSARQWTAPCLFFGSVRPDCKNA